MSRRRRRYAQASLSALLLLFAGLLALGCGGSRRSGSEGGGGEVSEGEGEGEGEGDGECEVGVEQPCEGPDAGECVPGVRRCEPGGTWGACLGALGPVTEICDQLDNDCDGETDEDYVCCEPGPVNPDAPVEEQQVLVCPGTSVLGSPGGECGPGCTCGQAAGQCADPRCSDSGCPGEETLREPGEVQVPVSLALAYRIGATEVTQAQWLEMEWEGQPVLNPSIFQLGHEGNQQRLCLVEGDCTHHPVDSVTWYEALAWCNWRSAQEGLAPCYHLQDCTGRPGEGMTCALAESAFESASECPGYRLPSEAEWERAARSGTATAYFGTELEDPRCTSDSLLAGLGWFLCNSESSTHEVGTAQGSPWGLYDMHGNVFEWTADCYTSTNGDLAGEQPDCTVRMRRGGAWDIWADKARSASRQYEVPWVADPSEGFRWVRTDFSVTE